MASSIIRRRWFGWANPNAPSRTGTPAVAGAAVTIPFGAPILPASPAVAQFTATVAGVARGITAAACAGNNLTLTLASAATTGQAVVVTYKPGTIAAQALQDNQGDQVSGFTVTISAT